MFMYGIDGPQFVLALSLGTIFSYTGSAVLYFWPLLPGLWNIIGTCILVFLSLPLTWFSGWMIYSSLLQKYGVIQYMIKEIENLNGKHYWDKVKNILDVGCGRGLFMNKIAKHILSRQRQNFKIHGIDIFSQRDQSGNSMENTLHTVKLEGIPIDNVEVKNSNAIAIDYPDSQFDLAVSSLVIHNIEEELGNTSEARKKREQALKEVIRVLKPGGCAMIWDIFYGKEYYEYYSNFQGVEAKFISSFRAFGLSSGITFVRKLN